MLKRLGYIFVIWGRHFPIRNAYEKMLVVVDGSFLEADEPVVLYQVNCVSVRPEKSMIPFFERHPKANVYASREGVGRRNLTANPVTPGTLETHVVGDQKFVALAGMWVFGNPGQFSNSYAGTYSDTGRARLTYFTDGIRALENEISCTVAIQPELGSGGGYTKNLAHYQAVLKDSPLEFHLYGY